MDPPAGPPRSALLAALRNNGTTEELRGIGYDVDLQGNWLADSLIFTADRLEGNLDNLPLGPRQILERHAAAFMSNAPARPSYVPARSISRPPSLNRPSTTSTWGRPYPDPHLLPRPGTDAWYEYKFGRTARPPPAPTPAPIPSSMTTMPFADSSPAPTAAVPRAGLPASLIMSPESADPSSFVSVGEEYRDDNKDDREDTDDEDADAEDKDEDEDDEYAHVLPLVSEADDCALFRSNLSTMPVAHGPAPAPAPATAGSYPTPAPVSALPVSGPAAVAGFPALPPPATSAPAPASAAAPAPAPAAAGYPAIPPPPNFPPIPAGFQLHSARGRYFLTGPDWTGGVPNPPALNFRGIRSLDGEPNENGTCRFCKCSKWLWFPTFFQRANDPQGLKHTCNRCVCRGQTSNQEDVSQQEWVRQRNHWLVVNRPIMFWLTRTGV